MKEIDIIGLIRNVLGQRRSLTISIICGAVFGVIIALSIPKTYTAEVLLAPELSSGGLGLSENLADMASSFGINLNSSGNAMDALYPEIYPEILSSDDFIYGLFNISVRLKNDDRPRTYIEHLRKDTKFPFWDYPRIWIAKFLEKNDNEKANKNYNDPFKIPKVDADFCHAIVKNITCLVDNKTSVIEISVIDQDPLVAAIVVDTIQKRLQEYITGYRTKKARNDYQYYTKLYTDAKIKYKKAQSDYAHFSDTNQEVVLERIVAKRDELENEMQLAFNLMNQMSTQMQTAKAKIQERTPAYTMIKSAKMPYSASGMSRAMIVFITIFLAVIVDFFWVVFLKNLIKKQ